MEYKRVNNDIGSEPLKRVISTSFKQNKTMLPKLLFLISTLICLCTLVLGIALIDSFLIIGFTLLLISCFTFVGALFSLYFITDKPEIL